MNYQDTSSLTGTDARSDADVIPAGSQAPAVGNTITGAGTVSGAAGADIIGSAPGQVVAIQGAGGADDSASGGTMQVSGRYGVLNMEGDGSYRYTRNGDTPDGVRDVFTYTLADADNARDTATLTIDIGREPVVVQANAQQVVVGPDGVVTLPAGVTLADIHVVGRNLVIDMPDGTQMVIVDGAVFVPQLVLGGVEVPSANVAALLIDSEPVPAAGNPQSSGGNFGLPPAPLDPGVPLGDLIPPVEQDYTPPIFEDVGQFVDDEPEIFIQPDGQPASVAAIDQVDERGLASPRLGNAAESVGSGEGADGNGTNNSDTRETTTGVILIDARDTPATVSITVNNTTTVITGTVPQVIQGQYGTLTITSVSDTQIGYSYTLRDNTTGDATHDDFLVTLTDSDGDQANATLRIDIIDDVPTANADVDSVTEDGPLVATGNILNGGTDAVDANTTDGAADVRGADGAGITAFSGTGGAGTFGTPLAGTYGSLVLNSSGGYVYTLNNQNAAVQGLDTGETLIETYNYTITDGDGDTSTTTLRITINGANDAPVAVPDTNWAQEDVANASGNVLQTIAHPGDPSPVLSFSDQADT
ncbi:MAG TPA: VCBS domain-containing protein, partial [Sphingomicrobium sp.]|nr:VCBS domain-containing protein [Sphingomicrobium sp.]